MKKAFKEILLALQKSFYFFPLRLTLNHVKENFVLGFSWFLILFIVLGVLGADYGVPILFLNPEYFGVVGYFSFQIVGVCLGAFFITWNLVSYLLYSYRYPFIASLKWPVAMFSFNNSLIPLIFLVIYVRKIIDFQHVEMGKENVQIFWMILGLFSGFSLVLFITSLYFLLSNKNIFKYIAEEEHTNFSETSGVWNELLSGGKADRVEYYLSRKFKLRPIRDVKHYDDSILMKVFQQHHFNAFLIILVNTGVLFGIGFYVENPFFELPAAGTVFLFFGLIISLSGLVYYWAGKWGTFALISIILSLNYFSKTEWMQQDSQAYGLDYSTRQDYTLDILEQIAHEDSVNLDINATLKILEKWKAKNTEGKAYNYKPKMVLVLSSGGGNRAAAYTMKTLQVLDSLSNGELMKHTFLMGGASGGMMGIGYFRELYLRQHLGIVDDLYNETYARNVSGDLINKITSTIVTNDLFFGFKKYTLDSVKYNFDRGTGFEIAFNNYTDSILKKPLRAYADFEQNATIPMMVLNTISVNDLRKFVISPLSMRYMMRAYSDESESYKAFGIDAVDFRHFFKNNNADNLNMVSAIRMNATYPLILPNVSLPSKPQIDVFDAGIRDNFGIETASRFINVFQNWIRKNTSGVVIIQIRDNIKTKKIKDFEYKTFMSKLGSSFGSIYSNITNSQDFLHDYMLDGIDDILDGDMSVYDIAYDVPETKKRASMSLRLSETELLNVIQAATDSSNQEIFNTIIEEIKK